MPGQASNPVLHQTHLKAGDKAPWFEGTDQEGNVLNLASFAGGKLLLYFYPKDDTPPCIAQACNLRDNYEALVSDGYRIVGVSADNALTHAGFSALHQLPFSLLADTDLEIIRSYDVWGPKMIAGRTFDGIVRTSFIIGPDGMIKKVINNPKTAGHAQQILALKK